MTSTALQQQQLSAPVAPAHRRYRAEIIFVSLIAAIPLAALVIFVLINGANMPNMDQWGNQVPTAVWAANGTLDFTDLLRVHSSHRMFFTRLLTAIMTYLTGWNIQLELMLTVLLAVANFALIVDMFRRDDSAGLPLVVVPFSALIFSLRQQRAWTWSLLNYLFFVTFFLLLALWLLRRSAPGWKPLAAAAVLSLCGTFTVGSGVLMWGVLPVVLWLLGYRSARYYLFWVASAGLSMALFLTDYRALDTVGRGSAPLEWVAYMLTYLGGPFVPFDAAAAPVAMILGVVGIIVASVNAYYLARAQRSFKRIAIWIGLVLFSVGSGLLTALGRSEIYDHAPHHPVTSRYVPLSTPFWIAVIALSVMALSHLYSGGRWRQRVWISALNVPLLLVLPLLYMEAIHFSFNEPLKPRPEEVACYRAYPVTRDLSCMLDVLPHPERDRIYLDALVDHRLTLFAGTTPSP